MTRQEMIDRAVALALDMAADPKHGYDQAKRWGPDYDCSSFVISAWEQAGVPVKAAGASYTGNMRGAFIQCGFADVKAKVNLKTGAGLEKGDVLVNAAHHTEMYVGNGQNVKASLNERGGVTGGQTGDQTGREIYVGSYYLPGYGWDCVLRYMGGEDNSPYRPSAASPQGGSENSAEDGLRLPVLARGDTGLGVLAMQAVLIARGFGCGPDGADSDFGANTEQGLRAFQTSVGIEDDGVCGPVSWACLLGVRT